MKKIYLLVVLMTTSLGYAQTFPIDFSDPLDVMEGLNGAIFTIVQDAGNDVGSIDGAPNQFYDLGLLTLVQNIDLSDDNNNTITFRVKPTADYGTRTHLLKFEDGTGPQTELPFTTTGTDWQNISINYPAGLGNYRKMVLFTDFANDLEGTYLFDDFAGGTNVPPPPPPPMPSGPAPTPSTLNGEVVLSLFNDIPGYTNAYVQEDEFGARSLINLGAASNETIKMDFAINSWGQFNNTTVDISAAGFLNLSYYAPDIAPGAGGHGFYIMINSGSGEKFYTFKADASADDEIVFDSWQNVSVPLSFFTSQGFDPSTFLVWKLGTISTAFTKVVYFDNIYFSVNPGTVLGIEEFNQTSMSAFPNPTSNKWTVKSSQIITAVQLFDVLGKQVLSLNPNAPLVTIDGTDLAKGLYFARINVNGTNNTVKLIKD